jgi:cytochrome c peroxidase
MRPRSIPFVVLLVLAAACGGGDAATEPTPEAPEVGPVVRAAPNVTLAAVVGSPFSYDLSRSGATFTDPAGGTLTYSVTLTGASGLSATGAVVGGTPTSPGVYTAVVTARDSRGNSATDTCSIVVFAAGLTTPLLPASVLAYSDLTAPLPQHFRTGGGPGGAVINTDNTPASNLTTDAGATLGRVLFYDPRLSANDAVSCGSCHVQSVGFADTARFSRGINGARTPRHSMPLGNARFYQRGRFFWDERAATLEAQVLQPIQDPGEMALSLAHAVTKIEVSAFYAPLFTAAFGSPEVTSDRIALALSQFVRSMVTSRSKHDAAFAVPGPPNFAGVFTAQELEGFTLFTGLAGCARCHATDAHVGVNVMNNGLDAVITDQGAGGGRFKAPSLRNVGTRNHFMHDGRFTTLDQVVEHYDSGVRVSPTVDQRLLAPNGQPLRLNLSASQRAALVAYLHTLTDQTFLTDVRFSDPFGR